MTDPTFDPAELDPSLVTDSSKEANTNESLSVENHETDTTDEIVSNDVPGEVEENKKEPILSALLEYLEILVLSFCAVMLIFTFGVRLCRVDGNSMMKTLRDQELLITASLAEVDTGDIIVFHQTSDENRYFNKPLVKRVIATEGQVVKIDYTRGEVYVDGILLDEPYIALLSDDSQHEIDFWTVYPAHHFDRETRIFEATVPEGCLFVMGDNRNNSADSRSLEVGFVDERRVLGKVICRLNPYTKFD